MRLFLSSQNLGNYPGVLLELLGNNKKLAFSENAKDDWLPDDRRKKLHEHREQFEKVGFDFTELDMRDFFDKTIELRTFLQDFGGIWLSGGNTFALRIAMQKSGLDTFLSGWVKQDKIVFGGSSAGSIIATPTLRGADWETDIENAKKMYGKDSLIWEGLNLVSYHFVPHVGSGWAAAETERMVDFMMENNLPYKALEDGQVILVNGLQEEFLK
jgi:dipeptidase E